MRKNKIKLWLIPLNDKRGEELCTHMYSPFRRFIARARLRRELKKMGYRIENCVCGGEQLILNSENSLVGKLKTIRFNRQNIEPTVFLDRKYESAKLKETILKSGCSFDYKEFGPGEFD